MNIRYAVLACVFAAVFSAAGCGGKKMQVEDSYTVLPGVSGKIRINETYSFTYSFDKKPAIGPCILRVEIFDAETKRTNVLGVAGDSGMPSMKGAHDTGWVAFKTNKAGTYLLPVNVVMPGDWEVKLLFSRDSAELFRGVIKFNV